MHPRCVNFRITPAQAGKSFIFKRFFERLKDHPRAGGEKNSEQKSTETTKGSPPRRRGKAPPYRVRPVGRGITPAQAGKRPHTGPVVRRSGDHPRAGGEKQHQQRGQEQRKGSPPRRRGKVWPFHLLPAAHRITPAQAGKRRGQKAHISPARDHPRAGGEKCWPPPPLGKVLGSPPRRRGKVQRQKVVKKYPGITPAQAGKSAAPLPRSAPLWDHPRAGGEKLLHLFIQPSRPGSPPRRRGKGEGCPAERAEDRITPAQAGKRFCYGWQKPPSGDHPRAGGEKVQLFSCVGVFLGSPPRRRGKGSLTLSKACSVRITPAQAGKS